MLPPGTSTSSRTCARPSPSRTLSIVWSPSTTSDASSQRRLLRKTDEDDDGPADSDVHEHAHLLAGRPLPSRFTLLLRVVRQMCHHNIYLILNVYYMRVFCRYVHALSISIGYMRDLPAVADPDTTERAVRPADRYYVQRYYARVRRYYARVQRCCARVRQRRVYTRHYYACVRCYYARV